MSKPKETTGYEASELINMLDDDIEANKDFKQEDYKAREYVRGNQLSDEDITTLKNRKQPVQIYNVFDEFVNKKLKGYFATTIHDIVAKPTQDIDSTQAAVATDLIRFELYKNRWRQKRTKAIYELGLTGMACLYIDVKKTDQKDDFGRNIYEIKLENVPSIELYPDKISTKADFSDSRRFHRMKWVNENDIVEKFPDYDLEKIYHLRGDNYTEDDNMEFETRFRETDRTGSEGIDEDMYLLLHTVVKEQKDKEIIWVSYYWCGDQIIDRKELVYEFLDQPYIVQKLNDDDLPGYYGLMHDHFGTQDAINQAIIQIQLMVSTVRTLIQEDAIPKNLTLAQFKDLIFRPNALIPLKDIKGIQLDKLVTEIQNYYVVIDRYLEMIQRTIGINDAFMGFAPAASSGKKVQIQQQAAVVALQYFAEPLEYISQKVGQNIIALAKQYYRAHQFIRVTDKHIGDRFVELNKVMTRPIVVNGQPVKDFMGNIQEAPFMTFATDPETEELLKDEDGNYIIVPANDPATALSIGVYDIMIETAPSGLGELEEREGLKEILSTVASVMPPDVAMDTAGMLIREMKLRGSAEISKKLFEASERMRAQQEQMMQQQQQTQQIADAGAVRELEEGGEG